MRTKIAQTKYTCDRCGATETVDNKSDASGWLFMRCIIADGPSLEDSIPRNPEDKFEGQADLCATCRPAFVAFLKGP